MNSLQRDEPDFEPADDLDERAEPATSVGPADADLPSTTDREDEVAVAAGADNTDEADLDEADDADGASEADADEDDARDEADIAGDFLEELLDIADIDGDFDIEDRDGRIIIGVSAEGDGRESLAKLGDSETVEALQHLTRLAVQAETGEFSRLILDVAGSRDARRAELEDLVATAVARLDAGAASAALPPMSSYERKIIHDLAADRGCTSESEGEGRDRHPVLRKG